MQQNIHWYASADACCFVLTQACHVGARAHKGTSFIQHSAAVLSYASLQNANENGGFDTLI